ncbi:MAG: T9SS type A sorting domain-containing protein, partial [Chitinophagales bacterium]
LTLNARVNPNTPTITTDIAIEVRLPSDVVYISHEFLDRFGVGIEQYYDIETGIWTIEAIENAPPHEINMYQLDLQVKVLEEITEPKQISAEFIAHTPAIDIDSQPDSFSESGFVHDEEDDEAIVTLYPVGAQPATIFGVTFRDGFRQGIDYLTVSKNQGIDHLTVYLYDANDLTQPLQTLETFSNDITLRGRYHFNHLDPNKDYVIEYQNATPELNDFFQGLLPGPVQRSPFLKPNDRFSEVIDVAPDEELRIDFAWVDGTECTLNSIDADAICDDKNTASPSDDTYNIRYTANGEGAFSVSGGITINAQEYPNNRLIPSETSYGIYPRFDSYEKWFEAELNLPVNGATSKTLTFSNDATFAELNCNETVVVPPPSSCSQLIDIELDFNIDNLAPVGFEGVTLTLVVTNTGSATAEDVEVEMYLFDNGFPDGKFDNQIATASQGSYEPTTLIWNVGDIAAGQTATLDVESSNPQLIEGETLPLFAQVTRAHGYDPDSDVNNDTDQTADEDDEGFILFGDDRKVDIELVSFYPVEASYNQADIVEFYMEVRNSSDAEIEMNGATILLDLPNNFVFDSFDFPACEGNCFYSAPAQGINGMTFFNLMPGESASTVVRYSVTNFTGIVDVFAQVASQVQGDIDSTPNNGTCCTPQEDDEAFAQVEITGDTNPEGVDLELQYEAASPTFNRWQKVNYTITIENKGTESATNVVVSTPIPTGLAFTSRTMSKGSFNLFFQTWTILELAAGETATLDLVLFTLANTPITNFAQVKSLDQIDVDSTPDNNATTIPQEDDEAAVTITPNSGGGGKDALNAPIDQATTLALYQLFPIPALDKLQVVFGTAGYQVNLFLYDVHGKQIRHQSLQIMRGENAIEVDVSELAAGFYTISLETPEGFVRGKFLKQ